MKMPIRKLAGTQTQTMRYPANPANLPRTLYKQLPKREYKKAGIGFYG